MKRSQEWEKNRVDALPKGEKHWNWSEKPNTLTLHKRIHRKYGPAKDYMCECGKQAKDWAFIGEGEYTDKRKDYKPMCRGCHMRLDGHSKNGNNNWKEFKRNRKGQFIRVD